MESENFPVKWAGELWMWRVQKKSQVDHIGGFVCRI